MHKTITDNLILLMTCGAFGRRGAIPQHNDYSETITPMSLHKWRGLVAVANKLNVLPFVATGAHMFDDEKVIPDTFFQTIEATGAKLEVEEYQAQNAVLYNHWTSKRLEELREEELNSGNISECTLVLLDIIITNAGAIITKDINVQAILHMGLYLQNHHKEIDFTKLGTWLSTIGMVQMASFLGNILIDALYMMPEEVPFAIKRNKKAKVIFHEAITNALEDNHSCSTATRLNVATLETLSHRFFKAWSRVTDVEE